jgi:Domain of unknown function (DUF5615)
VKFLADMGISLKTVAFLHSLGHDAVHLADQGLERLPDRDIVARIIDPDFRGLDRLEREPEIWKLLHRLPEDVLVSITMLLLLTPEEAEHSLASQKFDHPIPSRV